MAFGFKEKLMTGLFRKFYDFVLNRRTIARANSLNLARIERRFLDIIANRLVNFLVRVTDITGQLRLSDGLRREREGNGTLVGVLGLKRVPVNRTTVKSWGGARLEPSDRKI